MSRFLFIFILAVASAGPVATPPPQPASGPGGIEYPFAEMTMHRYGDGDSEYWIFEPAGPTPKSEPVIIFNHGWGVMTPNAYGAWIRHLVRRGNIVIYPRYQSSLLTKMTDFTPNAVAAVKAALAELQAGDHVRPQLDRVAIVGHSMGGAITANMAAMAPSDGLPIPEAFCCVEPANKSVFAQYFQMPMENLHQVPARTLALVITGDRDVIAGNETAKWIFWSLKQIPAANKDYVTLVSDDHGTPPLVANHMAPIAVEMLDHGSVTDPSRQRLGHKSLDALDYYGTWKLFDGLMDAAFYGKNVQYALGDTPEQRYMGKWSDGTPVKELRVTERP